MNLQPAAAVVCSVAQQQIDAAAAAVTHVVRVISRSLLAFQVFVDELIPRAQARILIILLLH